MEALADDQSFKERGIRETMKHPEIGDYVMSGWFVRFSDKTPNVTAAPLLGKRGDQILAEWLNYDTLRIANFKNDEVIG